MSTEDLFEPIRRESFSIDVGNPLAGNRTLNRRTEGDIRLTGGGRAIGLGNRPAFDTPTQKIVDRRTIDGNGGVHNRNSLGCVKNTPIHERI